MDNLISILYGIFIFAFGAVVGSFTNVLIYRLPKRKSIIFPGSHCPNCSSKIKPYDNIPIISYIILGGKCRNCKAKISIRYPIVELLMGLCYLTFYIAFYPNDLLRFIQFIILAPIFLSLSWIDIEHWEIPDELSISIIIVGLTSALLIGSWKVLLNSVIAGGIGAIIFWILSKMGKKIFQKEALGEGDIILIAGLGTLVGVWGVFIVMITGALIGMLAGFIVLFIRKSILKQKKTSSAVPFGPFLIIGAIAAILWGKKLVELYLSTFQ